MQYSLTFASVLALAGSVVAAPGQMTKRSQTVYLAGDSTMAKSPNPPIQGWGVYAQDFLSLPVVNKAIGGRSSRSFTDEGRFSEIVSLVQPNDIVVIEFGHNDGGGLSSSVPDNGRAVCGGSGEETCTSTYNGKTVTVHTFPWYLIQAGKAIIAKDAKVIISSMTPNNPWEGGKFVYSGGRFVTYAQAVAQALGSNAMYVDHGAYAADAWSTLGLTETNGKFPIDHTHTNAAGAQVVAQAFFKGLECAGEGFLEGFVKSPQSIPGKCL